jgi:hypothetical protein
MISVKLVIVEINRTTVESIICLFCYLLDDGASSVDVQGPTQSGENDRGMERKDQAVHRQGV